MPENNKDKRIGYIQKVIFKYTTVEPILTEEEIAFAILFHLDSEKFLKAIKKESKAK